MAVKKRLVLCDEGYVFGRSRCVTVDSGGPVENRYRTTLAVPFEMQRHEVILLEVSQSHRRISAVDRDRVVIVQIEPNGSR